MDLIAKAFIKGKAVLYLVNGKKLKQAIEANKAQIEDYVIENDRRNSAIPLLDMKNIKARIEPGADYP